MTTAATIRGTVLDLRARPVAGAYVRIGGQVVPLDRKAVPAFSATPAAGDSESLGEQVAITDQNGQFTIGDVQLPYDIVVVAPVRRKVLLFRGMQGTAPSFRLDEAVKVDATQTSHAKVTLTFPQSGAAKRHSSEFYFAGGAPQHLGEELDSRWLQQLNWDDQQSVRLQAFSFNYDLDPTSRIPARFTGFQRLDRQVEPNESFEWSVRYEPLPSPDVWITATVSLPAEYTLVNYRVHLLDPVSRLPNLLYHLQSSEPNAMLPVPNLPDLEWLVEAIAVAPDGSQSFAVSQGSTLPNAVTVLNVAPVPQVTNPHDGGELRVGIDEVVWDAAVPGASCAYLSTNITLRLERTELRLCSASNSARIPNVSRLGIGSLHGAIVRVEAFQWGYESVDAATNDCMPYLELCNHGESAGWGTVRTVVSATLE